MSRNEAVSPLRINKTPTKGSGRPLSEIGAMSPRRNSPSFDQTTKVCTHQPNHHTSPVQPANVAQRVYLAKESSPFAASSSPFNNPAGPRLFWREQTTSPKSRFESDNENEGVDPPSLLSPKRNSIENLKKQSRVKNSSMFAREQQNEYDPSSILSLDRPLAAGRPLNAAIQGNAYAGNGLAGLRQQNASPVGHRRADSSTKIPILSPSKTSPAKLPTQSSFASSPTRDSEGRASPTKSSLVSNGRFNSPQFNPDSSVYSDDEDSQHKAARPPLRRHAKSVTFDTAPPQITEFEMVTPDPSAASGSREGSYESDEDEEMSFDQDDSFDASLEDTEKTPVVLPEDWRHMSPDAANTSLTDTYDDVFDGRDESPMPNAGPNGPINGARHGSVASEGESRPLPPLPGMLALDDRRRRDSSTGLSAAAERASDARRSLPLPPQAAGISKSDLLNMRDTSMSLEDRLRLLNFDGNRNTETPTQETHDQKPEEEVGVQVHVDEIEDVTESELADEDQPHVPRISRESILRRVKSRTFEDDEGDSYGYDVEFSPERSYGDLADLDPDVPIPSRECSSNFDELAPPQFAAADDEDGSVIRTYPDAKAEEVEDESEVSELEPPEMNDYERESSVIRHPVPDEPEEDDDASMYSTQPEEHPTENGTVDTSGPSTPTAVNCSPSAPVEEVQQGEFFAAFEDKEVNLDLDPQKESFTPILSPLDTAPKMEAMHDFLRRPVTPEGNDEDIDEEDDNDTEAPSTPDSVIRHNVVVSPPDYESSPEVPEREATIRGAGGRLKTRPSLIPDEIDMAATRRQVSGTYPPPVPARSPNRQSLSLEVSHVEDDDDSEISLATHEKRMLDLNLGEDSNDLSFGLDKEFDNIIEAQKVHNLFPLPPFARFPTPTTAQHDAAASYVSGEDYLHTNSPTNNHVNEQKGYLMRQNTKVVVASSRQFSDEKPSADAKPATEKVNKPTSRKSSAERKPAWTTEPWNGKSRRKSLRTASGSRRAPPTETVPPLPGQESAVTSGLAAVAEQGDEELEEGEERGRVFVKVVGVKDLDLPLPKNERTPFQLTLDNGLHCVTTSWLELGHSAAIGQEFELVVLDDLEFQLTLQTKLEPPVQRQITAAVINPVVNHKKSHSTFRNLLSSPKKRKEQERRAQEEADRAALQQQQEAQAAAKRNHQATAWDLLHDLVGPDGSFARAYVCLNNHENQAYGRPYTVDIPCFNEWAVDDSGASSVKSKRGGVVRRPPYRIGKLTLQLLYVPKPKNASDDDMPKSMNACIRELREAEEVKDKTWEGHLSQQGGDCPFWRRRYFRLNGTKLTAFHETTRQPRATINLAKATKLFDDKSALKQPSSTKTGGRRKSAFAEDEEGYMFVEEGFRIRFANGEVIDFYADNCEQKEGWMKVLSETVGKDIASGKAWTNMVLDKERREKAARSQAASTPSSIPLPGQAIPFKPHHQRTQSHDVVGTGRPGSTSPVKTQMRPQSSYGPVPPAKDPRHAPAPKQRDGAGHSQSGRREQVRSMIF
ncbi:DUF1709-domain-containing protein [Dothidotthia symphoricarpi CBS 119687]|uniref:DUF1709-domain-containing protein n=1 Tax=Dothidotthia symphoricarpi CBS 119687 TaxID=1392245 RepID=A0A6A6A2F2_9PLEO|nr:DUF1709-domain-containing protein [Dothidotthia symphoricarpi CBS 119687]KAF2126029.1 DUF1709-domain-containing protein [Dothidotthia symphoricarpi CBS 119687]